MRTLSFVLFLVFQLHAEITNVRVEPTPTQAVIYYTAPDSSACAVLAYDMNLPVRVTDMTFDTDHVTVTTALNHGLQDGQEIIIDGSSVSAWNAQQNVLSVSDNRTFLFSTGDSGSSSVGTVGVLVNDVNNALFANSHLDSRAGNNNSGRYREFVLGTRKSEIVNGTSYSRALQVYSRHKFFISCGVDTHAGEFTTKNIPLGALAVDRPVPAAPGESAWPSLDKSARWDKSNLVFLDRVIDPLTGVMYTQMYPPEIATDTSFGLSTTNTPTPTGTNWVNPGNVRTQDATSATYTGSTRDILCIKPHLVTLANAATKADWLTQVVSLENLTATVRASGAAATQADRDLEIALNINGDCSTPATEWKTLSPSGSLADVSFPTGTPKGGFADWHSATQRRLIHSDVVTRRGYVNTSGTAATSAATGSWLSLFNTAWGTGATVRIGGTAGGTCADGTEYTVSSVESPRNMTLGSSAGTQTGAFWCAPSFAVLLRKKSTSTDSISVDYVNFSLRTANIPATHNSGSAKIFSEKPVTDGDGNVGYLAYSGGAGGTTSVIHWVSKDNGESRSIMGHLVNLPGQSGTGGWASGICGATENSFISTEPESFVCAMTGNSGGQVLVKYTMHGTNKYASRSVSFVPWSSCTTTSPPSPDPCLSAVNLHAGYTLSELIQDRNPDFDPTKFATCGIRGVQTHLIIIACSRGPQDTIGWYNVFDMNKPIASYNPSDQTTNPLIGALNPTHPALRGWGVYHTGWVLPGSEQFVLFDPKFGRKNSTTNVDGAGPWAMRVVGSAALNNTTDVFTCPANQWNHTNCSTVHVTSQPIDPDPGPSEAGTAGEYGVMAVGNGVRLFQCDSGASAYTHETITEGVANSGCQTDPNDEAGRILEISGTAPDITLTVARGITSTGMKSHASGYSLYQWPMTDYNAPLVDINVIWDVLNAPTGSEEHVKYARTNTSHGAMTSHALVGYGLTGGYDQLAWINPTLETLVQDPQVDLGLPSSVWPAFAGRYGLRFAGTIQRYAANNHTDFDTSRETAYQFYLDSRPFMAAPGNDVRPAFSKIGGTSYLYKYEKQVDESSVPTYFKHIPYLVYVQGRVLLEKSGPGVTLADTSEDWWKFCLAYRADECRTGSTPGDVYVNSPYMNLTNNALYTCLGGTSWEEADICAGHLDPVIGPSIQFWFGSGPNMGRGRHIRKLGWGVQEYKLFGQVPKVFPTGEWAGPLWTNFLNSHRSGGLMMKLPPIPPEDGIDRTTFVPVNVSVGSVPAGTSVAQVEFGYNDFGTAAQLYCTARQESCLATTNTVIGDTTITGLWTTSNTNATWQYINSTVAATTPIEVTTTAAHKFTNDVKVRASSNTSGLNSKLWSINVTGPTKFELVDSTSGDVGASSTQRVFVFKEDPPFAFSGESFSVASASNASPIEIGTTTAHRFRTGSRICISGVGGNTAANGCWAVTATGPSTFTLDSSTGNGSYTAGGTVTPGGVACASGCTVTIPGVTGRVLYYRWRYLNSGGAVITTGNVHTTVVP